MRGSSLLQYIDTYEVNASLYLCIIKDVIQKDILPFLIKIHGIDSEIVWYTYLKHHCLVFPPFIFNRNLVEFKNLCNLSNISAYFLFNLLKLCLVFTAFKTFIFLLKMHRNWISFFASPKFSTSCFV